MIIKKLNISLIASVGIFIAFLTDAIHDVGKTLPANKMNWLDVLIIAMFMIGFFVLGYTTHLEETNLSKEREALESDFDD